MIIKITGVIMVLVGCFLAGISVAGAMKKRLLQLREIENILAYLSGEIEYNMSPLSQAFFVISNKVSNPFKNWLTELSDSLFIMDGRTFREIWIEKISILYEKSFLKKDDLRVVEDLGQALGYLDVKQQLSGIRICDNAIKSAIVQAEKNLNGELKTAISMGILAGIFIVIILV